MWQHHKIEKKKEKKHCSRHMKGIYKIIIYFFEGFFFYRGISAFLGFFVCSQKWQ
jgi:hypothetical protein